MKKWRKPLWIASLAVTVATLMGSVVVPSVLAAAPEIYLAPSSTSVQSGAAFTVAVRINPGTGVTNVQAAVNYDASKLQFVSIDGTGSAFETALGGQTGGSGSVSISRVTLSGTPVSTDSLVDTLMFKAIVGSGSTNLGFNSAPSTVSYDPSGNSINATLSGTTINLTTPVTPSCASGQTGTYPNCVTPQCPSGQTGTYPNCKAAVNGNTTPAKPSGGAPVTPATPVSPAKPDDPKVTNNTPNAQYTQASVVVASNVPTKAYIQYGLSASEMLITTPVSELSTTHTIALNSTTLVPGQTYYYTVFTTNATGTTSQTAVATFKLKGLQAKISVVDKNRKALANTTVTFHSTPVTAKTDGKGYLTVSNITPGIHHLTYTVGKTTYTQELQVLDNIVTVGSSQTSPVQNFSVVFPITQSNLAWQRYVIYAAVVLLIVLAVFIFVRKQRQLAAQPVLVSDSKIVTSSTGPVASISAPAEIRDIDRSDTLNQIAGSPLAQPGSTIAPQHESVKRKGF